MPGALPAPYGGALVNPVVDSARAAERLRSATQAASWDLTPPQLVDLELLLTGALSPLRGYMTRENEARCLEDGRLADGTTWPVPIVLSVSDSVASGLSPRTPLLLRDLEGVPLAVLWVEEAWPQRGPDTDSSPSPSGSPSWRVAGLIEGVRLPIHHDFAPIRRTPAGTRAALEQRGWTRTLAVPLTGTLQPALVRATLEAAAAADAGLLVLVLLPPGRTTDAESDAFGRIRDVQAAFQTYPAGRALLSLLPWNGPVRPDRDRLLRAIVARNFGCSHLAHPAGVAAHDVADVGVIPVGLAVPLDQDDEREHRLGPPERRGFTVFLTGLSGSGKSTIANILRVRLLEHGVRRVTLLDGDLVRKHLSSELGFSREHRDINVRRIAYVASEITRHGGAAICAPIAPYDAVRREGRAMVEAVGDFVLVFVDTPLEVCEARDPKGLYAKARAGLLPSFTGVSDPYERPDDADIVIDTTMVSPETAADRVVDVLRERGYFPAPPQ